MAHVLLTSPLRLSYSHPFSRERKGHVQPITYSHPYRFSGKRKKIIAFSKNYPVKTCSSYPITFISSEKPRLESNSFDRFKIDVGKWISKHVTLYEGDSSFLEGPTDRTIAILKKAEEFIRIEKDSGGVLDIDNRKPSNITSYGPGYIDRVNEIILGFQTDKPLKRAIKPRCGAKVVKEALEANGNKMHDQTEWMYTRVRKTHNQAVTDCYTREMVRAKRNHILSGLPDFYGRGRLVGDYRRVALYGVDQLIIDKQYDLDNVLTKNMTEEIIRLREEVTEQMRALIELKMMAKQYDFDISEGAKTSKEAVQWLYFAYLASVKQQDGASMPLGRIDAFLDIFIEKDLQEGIITERDAQEMIDDFVIKLMMVRHLRTPEYENVFSEDLTNIVLTVGGTKSGKEHLITKTTYRILNTLNNLKWYSQPCIAVLWHSRMLPDNFKAFCSKLTVDTALIKYENDVIMYPSFGPDYAISYDASAVRQGKDVQYHGGYCNIPKLLLYTINNGRDEITGNQVGPDIGTRVSADEPLNIAHILTKFDSVMEWMASLYADSLNIIHRNHDLYNYESIQMAMHDTDVRRIMAFGICGIACLSDSLSAIKHAQVYPVFDDRGLVVDFDVRGKFPLYGTGNDSVDEIARWIVNVFYDKISSRYLYRDSIPFLSASSADYAYGQMTGKTPDGRDKGKPYGSRLDYQIQADASCAYDSVKSLSKIKYASCLGGMPNTLSLVSNAIGETDADKINSITSIIDEYMDSNGHYLKINVLDKEYLEDIIDQPEKYPDFTFCVSGNYIKLTDINREKRLELALRLFHNDL
ncbi:pyruvate formate-lyase [Tetraselmis virus 1]|uniref:formate C-acetyltransferase n=1 Tax=Tetraselmis virus 1 TaxID=2060617 RepID=A0A2P0VNR5_9VIRU|nr:pyruvate formate-lyase [Tetraselmis virus 1]AUF82510.1 pyruvate formate-lyase [Tetraselmis virus 1]